MKKGNIMFLLVTAVATLLITAAQASFAYSATSMKNTNNGVNEDIPQKTALFSSTSGKDLDITINTLDTNIITDSTNISVNLLSSEEGHLAKCTYDIIYVWTSDPQQDVPYLDNAQGKYYNRTATVNKEFTIETSLIPNDLQYYPINTEIFGEKNMDEYILYTDDNGSKPRDYIVLVDDAVITSASSTEPTTIDYNFTLRFYNENKDQAYLNGRSFKGYVAVNQDSIEC